MNNKKNTNTQEDFKKMWERYSYLMGADQTEDVIEEGNALIGEIEKILPFKDHQEHQNWLTILFGYRFWEDFEEITLEIANRLEKNECPKMNVENIVKYLQGSYIWVQEYIPSSYKWSSPTLCKKEHYEREVARIEITTHIIKDKTPCYLITLKEKDL